MKYDLIVCGAGPGGMMAAATAGEDGMNVLLLERKREPAEVSRACLQILYVKPISPLASGKTYMEPVSVDVATERTLFHNLNLGFTLEHAGQLRPYMNWVQLSPAGNLIHRFKPNDYPWGFFYDKPAFLAGMLERVRKAGITVLTETVALGAENTASGVTVRARMASGAEQTFEAAAAIAADGVASRVAETLGLAAKRKVLGPGMTGINYIVEGFKTDLPGASLYGFSVPSIDPARNVMIGQGPDNTNIINVTKITWEQLTAHRTFAPMLRNARLVKRTAFAADARTPLMEPVAGNVVVIGDAAAPIETWIMGAAACGFQAVRAIQKHLAGKPGYQDYIRWWQGAFSFNQPDYFKVVSDYYIFNRVCTDEDVDFVFGLFKDRIGIPSVMVEKNMDLIRQGRPELYERFVKAKEQSMWKK